MAVHLSPLFIRQIFTGWHAGMYGAQKVLIIVQADHVAQREWARI